MYLNQNFLILIYPFTPHVASECWEKNFKSNQIHTSKWPDFDSEIIKDRTINIVIQINGKKKSLINMKPNQKEELIFSNCLKIDKIKKLISEKKIIKKIYVKNKLVNIVVK